MPAYLAVDLGAASGRVLRGDFDGTRLEVSEVRRFGNGPLWLRGGLYWDIDRLYAETLDGIAAAVRHEPGIRSVGVDAWGNDFGLLDSTGALVARPWHHRTPRTSGMVHRLLERADPDEVYAVTGTQFLPITTACQLLAMQGSRALSRAEALVTIPDLFTSWLSDRRVTEASIASTTQLWHVAEGTWARGLIEQLGFDNQLFSADVATPGTPIGGLGSAAARAVRPPAPLHVVAVAGHDTACAVAAVPANAAAFAYISCGTWSLVGMETDQPITTPAARHANFTNETGVDGSVQFHSNVNGLWLLQECRRVWAIADLPPSYAALGAAASAAPAYRSLIDPDHPTLLGSGDMPARIARLCQATGEPAPRDRAETVRCVIDSLASKYRWTLDLASALVGRQIDVIHMVGGGAANTLLCQQTADLTGHPVVAGPVEATGIGNLLVQAMADDRLDGLSDIRAVTRTSFSLCTYEPSRDSGAAADAYGRFQRLVSPQSRADVTPGRQLLTSSATT